MNYTPKQLEILKLIYQFQDHFALLTVLKATILFGFMLLPTVCLGATFPLVGKIYTQSLSRVGRSIGFAYSINTVGAVLGSLCAGFLLIPFIGKEQGLSLIIGVQLLTSLVIGGSILWGKREGLLQRIPIIASALLGLLLCLHFPNWDRYSLSSGKYHRFGEVGITSEIRGFGWWEALWHGPKLLDRSGHEKLVYYGDGIGGFTTVFKKIDPLGSVSYTLYNSGKPDASTLTDMGTETLLAHFPMLFHPGPKAVMVLGLASGITAGEVLHYPIERLDVIDINRQTVSASDFFIPWNNKVISHPKTKLIIQDGRAHLQLTKRRYDVVISEPSNPWMAGLANLYTHEFFSLVRDRLNDNGIFCQWIHSYQMDWATFSLIGRTFLEVFPNSLLVRTAPYVGGGDWLLIGLKGNDGLILDNAQQKLSYAQQSRNISLLNPKSLYRLIASEDLRTLFGQGHINTDNWPGLEFVAPKQMYINDPMIERNIQSKKWLSQQTRNIVDEIIKDIDAQIDFAAFALSLHKPFHNMVDHSKATPQQKKRFVMLMETYCANNLVDFSIFKDDDLKERCFSLQIETIKSKLDTVPNKAVAYSFLGDLYCRNGMLDEAIAYYHKALEIKPDFAEAFYNLGFALSRLGRIDDAITKYQEALRIRPHYTRAHESLAIALSRKGRFEEAIRHFSEVLRMEPDDAKVHFNLAISWVLQGRIDNAITEYREALRLRPRWSMPLDSLAWIFATSEDPRFRNGVEAIRLAEQASKYTSYKEPIMLDTLAAAYAEAGRFNEALLAGEKAMQLALSAGRVKLAREIRDRIRLYRLGIPFRQISAGRNP